jgi:hypothetical protein
MRVTLVGITITMVLPWAGHQPRQEAVPFVGCPADGQVGPIEAPQGKPRVVALGDMPTREIAYYQGAAGPGVFAPRGWHCRRWYGSAGSTLLVTPEPFDSPYFPRPKIRGYAVEVTFHFGGTSGRFAVARYATLLFPGMVEEFVERVKRARIAPAPDLERPLYPHDSVTSPDSLVAEFTTPANTTGFGTEGLLEPSQDAIRGAAFLDASAPDGPNVSVVRIRLGSGMHQVEAAFLSLNEQCMQRGC